MHYDNLAIRAHDWEPITELNETSLPKITAVCLKHHGWFIASSRFDDQPVMLMKEQTNKVRVETRRLTFQITVELGSEKVVKFSTYGHELSMSHIRTLLRDDTYVSCSAIDVLITFIETATPWLGQPVPEDTNEYLKVPVCNSRVISVSIPGTGTHDETRLVSLSCTFLSYACPNLITNVISCHECSKVHRLFGKRERKREKNMDAGSQKVPHNKCNQAHLSRKGLEVKIENQNKKRRKELERLKEEDCFIQFEDEDHADLVKIFSTTETKDMAPEMKLLWETQMKQFSAKSANGHRWDPRIVRLALDMYCKSPKALDSMREYLILPSNRLIRYYKNSVDQKPGWNREIIKWCKHEAERQKLKVQDYWGVLVFDEMKIQCTYTQVT